MLNHRYRSAALLVFIAFVNASQAEESKPIVGDEVVVQFKLGGHTYMEEFEPSLGSSGLWGLLIGVHLNKGLMVGCRFSHSSYKLVTMENFLEREESKSVNSFIAILRWRFRADDKFQPYIDMGIGTTDPIARLGKKETAYSVAIGAQYKFNDFWAVALESRGLSWFQYAPQELRMPGKSVFSNDPISANEATLSFVRFI